ncbi:hypothetical protein C0J52_07351 [Blattella germanica]|nr:hypothetical protein C0J52_07351 [Blattella germanica]
MGLLTHLGNFDECIGIENVDTQFGLLSGQHCLASISLAPSVSMKYRDSTDRQNESLQMTDHSANRKAGGIFTNGVDLRLSYCIPSSCSAEEFQTMFNHNLSNVSNKINITVRVPQEMCQTSEGKKLALEDWIAVGIIATIGMLAIMSTAYDLLKTESKTKILTAFSWYINGKKLLSTETSGETLQAIHGIRFLSICWVVMGHRYSGFFSVPAINASSFLELIPNFWRIYLTNGTLAVDTFFYLSGLLVSYIFLKEMNKKNSSFNIFSYYFHRYIRLTPPYAMMMLLTATLLRYAGSGPLYYAGASASAKICQQYWWKSILYINNYIEIEKMCVGQGWYLAIDMQLFILSPVILYPLWKWRKTRSLTFLGALIVGGLVTAFTVCFVERFPAGVFMGNNEIHRLQYYPTHTRFTPWLIGVAFGFLFHETKRKNIKLPKVIVFLGWCLATTALLGSLLGIYPFNRRLYDSGTILNSVLLPEDFFPRFESSIYIALSRSSWALGVGWVSYACVFGYGGQ